MLKRTPIKKTYQNNNIPNDTPLISNETFMMKWSFLPYDSLANNRKPKVPKKSKNSTFEKFTYNTRKEMENIINKSQRNQDECMSISCAEVNINDDIGSLCKNFYSSMSKCDDKEYNYKDDTNIFQYMRNSMQGSTRTSFNLNKPAISKKSSKLSMLTDKRNTSLYTAQSRIDYFEEKKENKFRNYINNTKTMSSKPEIQERVNKLINRTSFDFTKELHIANKANHPSITGGLNEEQLLANTIPVNREKIRLSSLPLQAIHNSELDKVKRYEKAAQIVNQPFTVKRKEKHLSINDTYTKYRHKNFSESYDDNSQPLVAQLRLDETKNMIEVPIKAKRSKQGEGKEIETKSFRSSATEILDKQGLQSSFQMAKIYSKFTRKSPLDALLSEKASSFRKDHTNENNDEKPDFTDGYTNNKKFNDLSKASKDFTAIANLLSSVNNNDNDDNLILNTINNIETIKNEPLMKRASMILTKQEG